jgi:hypothetical protein
MSDDKQLDPIAEFLAKGGKIQQIPSGVSGRVEGAPTSAWGAPRKAGRPAQADTVPIIEEDLDD